MRKTLSFVSICICASFFCACASIPDMTAEQEEMVSEYAAALMLKYDAENHSRLVDVSNYIEEYNQKKQAFDDAARKYLEEQQKLEEEQKKEEEERKEETIRQEQLSSGSNASSSNNDATVIIVGDPLNYSDEPLNTYIGLDGFDINFYDFAVEKELVTTDAFNISAEKGTDLLVVYFTVKNTDSGSRLFDVLSKDVKVKFSVNGDKYISAKINTSDDDLAQAYVTFAGNESKRMLLIAEIKEGTNVENLTMKVEIGSKSPIVKTLK